MFYSAQFGDSFAGWILKQSERAESLGPDSSGYWATRKASGRLDATPCCGDDHLISGRSWQKLICLLEPLSGHLLSFEPLLDRHGTSNTFAGPRYLLAGNQIPLVGLCKVLVFSFSSPMKPSQFDLRDRHALFSSSLATSQSRIVQYPLFFSRQFSADCAWPSAIQGHGQKLNPARNAKFLKDLENVILDGVLA